MAHLASKRTFEFLCGSDQWIVPYLLYHLIFFMVAHIVFFFLMYSVDSSFKTPTWMPYPRFDRKFAPHSSVTFTKSSYVVWYTMSVLLMVGFLPLLLLIASAVTSNCCRPVRFDVCPESRSYKGCVLQFVVTEVNVKSSLIPVDRD